VQTCEKQEREGGKKNNARFPDHPKGQSKSEVQSILKINSYDTLIFLVKRNRMYTSGNIHSIVCLTASNILRQSKFTTDCDPVFLLSIASTLSIP
jgi:hypothetical protein